MTAVALDPGVVGRGTPGRHQVIHNNWPGLTILVMKATSFAVACYALLAAVQASTHDHGHHHLRHHLNAEIAAPLERKGGQCQFPTDAGLVAVTPNEKNAGWAMSPDQACLPGHYCPYACPPGQLSMQWDPDATSYSYPQSMV